MPPAKKKKRKVNVRVKRKRVNSIAHEIQMDRERDFLEL